MCWGNQENPKIGTFWKPKTIFDWLLPNWLRPVPGLVFIGVSAALTWYRATLVCSRKAGRLLADPWVTDLELPPSTALLNSLPLSTCGLWDRYGVGVKRLDAVYPSAYPAQVCPLTLRLGVRWRKVSS